MSDNLHIAENDLALYAMGALSAEEMARARAHVAGCAQCKEELRQIEIALAAYAQTTPEAALPAGAKQRFMARLAESEKPAKQARAQVAKPSPTWSERWFGTTRWTGALATAMALLLLIVGFDDLRQRAEIKPLLAAARQGRIDSAQLNQLMELLTSSQAKRVALHQTPSPAPPPEGRVVYSAHNGKLLLTAQNLHPLPAGKTYELWILQPGGKKPLPAGTFAPDSSGNASMILADEPANLPVQGFAVTVENAGGSETPTPPLILSGQ
jgi:anti-sigma-K factor RskA